MPVRRLWLQIVSLIALGLGSTVTNLGNRFTQDDMPVIERNPTIHSLAEPLTFFTQSYWPKPFPPALYRPLATTTYAIQWAISGGKPWFFHAMSIVLYLGAGLALYLLAVRLLPPIPAWLVGAFFLVHPVHVEAVAVAVNQSEIVVGLLAALTVILYLSVRTTKRFGAAQGAALFALSLGATLFKETGLMLIGLIVAAELFLVEHPEPIRVRLAAIRPLLLVMLLGAASFLGIRTLALEGDPIGTFTAEALDGLNLGQRALTMLGVVPHWFRLLLWPAHLQGDYSPREIESATSWGTPQTLGALLLLLAMLLAIACRRKNRVVTFGLAWAAVGIFPVSNVLVPTGIALAERTLFLPSAGMMLAVGGLAALALDRLRLRTRWLSYAAAAAVAAVLVMGLTRSASRQRVWQDQITFWRQTTIDAPLSYRAHHALAQLLFQVGSRQWAEKEYKLAIALYPKQWGAYFDLANKLRLAGMCEPAVRYYRQTLLIEPEQEAARSSLIACLLYLGRYPDARAEAREGMSNASRPGRRKLFQKFFVIADSAAATSAAPGTVTLTIMAQDTIP
jgi:tetratricopeptide (TPR) repeat protein